MSQMEPIAPTALANQQDTDQTRAAVEPLNVSNDQHSHHWTKEDRKRLFVLIGSAVSQLPIWGFAMSYGVLQQYFFENWTLQGARETTGIIGTTSNGVMYLSMPFLFALFTQRLSRHRQTAALIGTALACLSFAVSSLSTNVWHLVFTQGVLAALGCTLIFSPLTLTLGEYFTNPNNRICNRAVAFAICLSTKNAVGATCPFIFRSLLTNFGFRTTLRIWAAILGSSAVLSIFLIPTLPTVAASTRPRRTSWSFLRHRTFYIYAFATLAQSAGYGIPQTYLTEYARNVSSLSVTFSTLLIALINIPGIASSSFFGFLSDNRHFELSTTNVTAFSALASAVSTFVFWGLAAEGSTALLTLFALSFGFFASGYSATWGGVMNEIEKEAREANEPLDTGVLYGLLNGARGVGYVSGGLVSVPLVDRGSEVVLGKLGYGTAYGPLILFTGCTLAFGGWGVVWKWLKPLGVMLGG